MTPLDSKSHSSVITHGDYYLIFFKLSGIFGAFNPGLDALTKIVDIRSVVLEISLATFFLILFTSIICHHSIKLMGDSDSGWC